MSDIQQQPAPAANVAVPVPVPASPQDRMGHIRTIRNECVDLLVSAARIGFFWIPGGDVAYGKALMTFHPIFLGAMIALFFLVPPRSPLRFYIAFFFLCVSCSQWLFGGCIITRAEQRLTGSKDTILDPFLALANIAVTRDTRNAATLAAGTLVCAMLIWAVFCDVFRGGCGL